MITEIGYIKKGDYIIHEGGVWQVAKTDFNFQGRGMATVKMKIKSISTGKNIDVTNKSNATIETADVETLQLQYLYRQDDTLYFMDERTFQQHEVPVSQVDFADYLKPEEKYYVMLYQDEPLTVRPPASVKLKVKQTEAAVKGDTVSGAKKPATLETGVTAMVPLFIKTGDLISVNPETGEYLERLKE